MFNTSLRYNFDSRQQVRPNQQTPLRQHGFGGHFKDAPPPFIREEPEDNKIERKKKPNCPKGHKVCKCGKKKKKKTKSK